MASCFFMRSCRTREKIKKAERELTIAHLGFDQVSSTLLLSAELIVGAGHLLSNLRLNCVDLLGAITRNLCGRWGAGRWRRRKSAAATSSSSTDDVDVDVASGSAVERAELGGASGVRNARQLAVVRRLIDLKTARCVSKRGEKRAPEREHTSVPCQRWRRFRHHQLQDGRRS